MTLKVEGLRKRFGKKLAVREVSFSMESGEIVGLLGPNGAGKTTVFYMIAGFLRPNAGKILLDEKAITRFPMYKCARAGIAYLPQEPSVFRKLSVEDNIRAILETRRKLNGRARKSGWNNCSKSWASPGCESKKPTRFRVANVDGQRLLGPWPSNQSFCFSTNLLQASILSQFTKLNGLSVSSPTKASAY